MGSARLLVLFAMLATFSTLGLAPGATGAARAADAIVCAHSGGAGEDEVASRWRCAEGEIDLYRPRNVVRLEVPEDENPRYLISRAAKFSAISVGLVRGERVSWTSHDFREVEATFFDRQVAIPLTVSKAPPDAVLVAVDGATQMTTFDYLRLEKQLPGSSPEDVAMLMIVALITGMMLMPILFDLVFWRILRERFILWHAALVACLAVQLICNFGLYSAYVDVHLPMLRVFTIGSFTLMVMTAAMFSLRFIEAEHIQPRIARAMLVVLAVFAAIALVHMAGIEALGRWPSVAYFTWGAPVAAAMLALLISAARSGSRTVRYLLVGLSPLLVVGIIRVASFLTPGIPTSDGNEILLAATVIEVSATALGVASRFLTLKHESDRVRTRIDHLEGAASHDSLTGLFNRRAIDERYEELRAQGFDTFALIDLDLFKDVNDRFGHQTGDAVLVACADAIRCEGDRDCIAVRLGGEEFVLLLRGRNVTTRAEKLRRAIPQRVASDVAGLDRLVTASMGVLELPRDALELMSFEEIYARADKLLYEAKASGRNRMLYERLRMFDPAARKPKAA